MGVVGDTSLNYVDGGDKKMEQDLKGFQMVTILIKNFRFLLFPPTTFLKLFTAPKITALI
ncbi:MAG: hypothetical protein CM15mV150_030 [Caudoviricetes sp.]|nr:MAG: hypothetical protein CM15mV150_030 [Caudoviricetes sp.]